MVFTIFPVTNRNMPEKICLVWNAADKVNGIALNDLILKSPDELVSLC